MGNSYLSQKSEDEMTICKYNTITYLHLIRDPDIFITSLMHQSFDKYSSMKSIFYTATLILICAQVSASFMSGLRKTSATGHIL